MRKNGVFNVAYRRKWLLYVPEVAHLGAGQERRRRGPVMKDFIEECFLGESMSTKWQFMLADARATLTRAFDMMIQHPEMISGYYSKTVKISGLTFNIQQISIGYASFVVATNPMTKIVLLDACLEDGYAVVEWRTLSTEARRLFANPHYFTQFTRLPENLSGR